MNWLSSNGSNIAQTFIIHLKNHVIYYDHCNSKYYAFHLFHKKYQKDMKMNEFSNKNPSKKNCNRPWQDSNLQSSDPKSDALSIRPHGLSYSMIVETKPKSKQILWVNDPIFGSNCMITCHNHLLYDLIGQSNIISVELIFLRGNISLRYSKETFHESRNLSVARSFMIT